MNYITDEELASIEENCLFWANNCGGCETCNREFKNPPLYNHQETYYLVIMIKDLKRQLAEIKDGLR